MSNLFVFIILIFIVRCTRVYIESKKHIELKKKLIENIKIKFTNNNNNI